MRKSPITSPPAAEPITPPPASPEHIRGFRRALSTFATGVAIILISSELEEVLRIAQRIVVMRDRRAIGELSSQDLDLDQLIDYIANKDEGTAA